MILYHYTSIFRFLVTPEAEIKATGKGVCEITELSPRSEQVKHVSCVWLTTEGDPGAASDDRNCLQVMVRIPDTDRKLFSLRKWLRHDPVMADLSVLPEWQLRHMLRNWYMYFGTIPSNRIIGFDII